MYHNQSFTVEQARCEVFLNSLVHRQAHLPYHCHKMSSPDICLSQITVSTTRNENRDASPSDNEAQMITQGRASFSSDDAQPFLNHNQRQQESWTPPKRFIWIQGAIMSNVFLYGFDGTITAATYAVISSEFDATNTASWLTTSYVRSQLTVTVVSQLTDR